MSFPSSTFIAPCSFISAIPDLFPTLHFLLVHTLRSLTASHFKNLLLLLFYIPSKTHHYLLLIVILLCPSLIFTSRPNLLLNNYASQSLVRLLTLHSLTFRPPSLLLTKNPLTIRAAPQAFRPGLTFSHSAFSSDISESLFSFIRHPTIGVLILNFVFLPPTLTFFVIPPDFDFLCLSDDFDTYRILCPLPLIHQSHSSIPTTLTNATRLSHNP